MLSHVVQLTNEWALRLHAMSRNSGYDLLSDVPGLLACSQQALSSHTALLRAQPASLPSPVHRWMLVWSSSTPGRGPAVRRFRLRVGGISSRTYPCGSGGNRGLPRQKRYVLPGSGLTLTRMRLLPRIHRHTEKATLLVRRLGIAPDSLPCIWSGKVTETLKACTALHATDPARQADTTFFENNEAWHVPGMFVRALPWQQLLLPQDAA